MVYRHISSYQKQAQTTWLSLRLISFSKVLKVFVLFIAIIVIFGTIQSFYDHTDHTVTIPVINKGQSKSESTENNVLVIVDGEEQGLSLHPIFCQLSTNEKINTHIIVTGQKRGLSKSGLAKLINEKNISCEVIIYDLDIKTDNEISVLEIVFQEISRVLNQIQPDVLLYIKNQKNYAIRGVDSALVTTSHLGITGISIPIEETKHLIWLAHLSIDALKHWNSLKVNIQVITQDRPDSLARLVRSLKSSYYFGDEISLTISMDRGADPVTKEYCRTLEWPFGKKDLRHRIIQGGLMAAVVESYYPSDDNDYAVMLEDDIELSPYFYVWTKYNILKYRYGSDRSHSNRMYGISFYEYKFNELYPIGRGPFDPAVVFEGTNYQPRSPFLWQVPCSWGAVYFPEVWREFHDYVSSRFHDWNGLKIQNITIPETRSNSWKKSWKKYLIELIYLRGYVMLYPNYENYTSFSTNHAEAGTHIHVSEGKHRASEVFGVPLMEEDTIISGLPEGRMPEYTDLPVLDLLGNLVSEKELIQRGKTLHSEVSLCPPNNELTFDPQDILCLDEKKRQDIMNEIETKNSKKKKISEAIKNITNETLKKNHNNETNYDSEKLFNVALEVYNNLSNSTTVDLDLTS